MRVSENFTLEELYRSETAVKKGIRNVPPCAVIWNLVALIVLVLEPLRKFMEEPVVITSGYRCEELNVAVGGVANSFHLSGRACDIRVRDEAHGLTMLNHLKQNRYVDKVLFEKSRNSRWLHVQISTTPRGLFNSDYRV